MMIGSLLPPPPANVHRIIITNPRELPKDYPEILRGLMKEDDFRDCLKHIEKGFKYSKKPFFIPIIPIIVMLIGIICIATTGEFPFMALIMIGFMFIPFSVVGVCVYISHQTAKGYAKIPKVLTETNTRFYPRGVKWTYNNSITHGGAIYCYYIDIITFTPGEPDAPPMEGAFFQVPLVVPGAPGAPNVTVVAYAGTPGAPVAPAVAAYPGAPAAPGAPVAVSAYPGAPAAYPTAPPPSKDAYMSKDAYPGAPGVQPVYEDGPNPYEKYPQTANPYHGDPANPNNYYV